MAFDSYKGSLSSKDIISVASEVIFRVIPDAKIEGFVIADGGEGTLESLTEGLKGTLAEERFTGLEFKKVGAKLGFTDSLCIIECAQTVGITYSDRQNVAEKSSIGMGEQILYAFEKGCREFAIGLGGSGTNDMGIGMLGALGFRFYDTQGNLLEPLLKNIASIARIDDSRVDARTKESSFTILSDVNNPLYGPKGATYVFGPQKGVTQEELPLFDAASQHFAAVAAEFLSHDRSHDKGAGAAGGLGYAFLQFLNAKAVAGIEYVLDVLDIDKAIANADMIMTGEGKSDAQTACGKVPFGVANRAKLAGKPVMLISGALDEGAYGLHDFGIDYITSIQAYPAALEDVIERDTASTLLAHKIEESVRLLCAGRKMTSSEGKLC